LVVEKLAQIIHGQPNTTSFAVKGETRFLGPKKPSLGGKPWLLMSLKTWFLKSRLFMASLIVNPLQKFVEFLFNNLLNRHIIGLKLMHNELGRNVYAKSTRQPFSV
jgi:hypothetical protein